MEDYIVRAMAAEGAVRAFAAVTTNMAQEARNVHRSSGVATAALGRTLTAAAIMGRMSKGEKDQLTIQIRGDGPIGGIIAVSDSNSNVRGYVYNPEVYLPLNESGKFDVSSALGKGYLNVIKDFGLKEPYIGYVDLVSGEIGEDIAYYYAYSEQIPSVVSLGVLIAPDENVVNAGGFIIQLLPGADDSLVDYLEDRISRTPPITALLSEGKSPEEILDVLLGEKGLTVTEKYPCRYVCNCSRDRMERNLVSLGRKELISLADEQHGAELQCHFCNQKYNFTEEEILELAQFSENDSKS